MKTRYVKPYTIIYNMEEQSVIAASNTLRVYTDGTPVSDSGSVLSKDQSGDYDDDYDNE